ncbi:hypothetical protein HA466_0198500 [Hirschfeldia incana]|nr:hypothetical protein HA466_0198500 [Hirschfeldia incana]
MVLAETAEATMVFTTEGPRISFSADLSSSDSEGDYICINPDRLHQQQDRSSAKAGDFEFLSDNTQTMLTAADELFSEGKLLPFRQVKHPEKLQNVTLKTKVVVNEEEEEDRKVVKEETVHNTTKEIENNNNRGSWFLDDDPSPRPPNCTVLWKELLRLKKQRNTKTTNTTTKGSSSTKASTLSPSSSSSSTSSSSSSIGDAVKEESEKKGKKGLERTRSVTMRIRPMIHVPVCTPSKPPLFPLRLHKNRVEKRT